MSSVTDGKLTIRMHSGKEGLSALRADWEALMPEVSRRCFYHHPDWFAAYFESRPGAPDGIEFVAVFRGDRLVAVLPIQCVVRGGLLKARDVLLPATGQLYMADWAVAATEDPGAVLGFVLENLGDACGLQWDRLSVADTLEGSLISTAVASLRHYAVRSIEAGACAVVPVQPYEDMLASLKAKFRQNINRARRKFATVESSEMSIVSDPEEVSSVFQEFIDLEASGWKGGHGDARGEFPKPMAIALGNQKRRFYEAAIRRFSKRNEVEIYCLRVEGKLIGAEVWLLQGDTCVALKTAYDEDYSNLSPGVLAFDLGYQHHAKRNTAKTINTITDTAAVNDWQPDRLRYLNHAVFNKTFRGRLLRVKSAFRRSS